MLKKKSAPADVRAAPPKKKKPSAPAAKPAPESQESLFGPLPPSMPPAAFMSPLPEFGVEPEQPPALPEEPPALPEEPSPAPSIELTFDEICAALVGKNIRILHAIEFGLLTPDGVRTIIDALGNADLKIMRAQK